ncbi:MAG TPA: hypothetical protein PLX15_01585 [Candidatus Woesearchaeota archaeon]|jgi:hypothetical protein|nr:hypothetical protein [Candidatus Woesearchaeota archaeon]
MATLLDFGFIANFSPLFTFIIVFVLTYVVLGLLKVGDKAILEGKSGLTAIIAFTLAILFSISPNMSKLIEQMAPGFVLFIVFLMFVLITMSTIGLGKSDLIGLFGSDGSTKGMTWLVIIVCLVIAIGAVSSIFGDQLLGEESANGDESAFQKNLKSAFFSPKVLGMVFIFFIAMFTILFVGPKAVGKK